MNPQSLVSELESIFEVLDLTPQSRFEIARVIRQLKDVYGSLESCSEDQE